MERIAVRSRAIASVGYDAAMQVLEIEYRSGAIYRYRDVPEGVYDWLLKTPNKGAYVTRMIANEYPFDTVGVAEPEAGALEQMLRASLEHSEGDESE